MNTNRIITAFKDAGWSGVIYPDLKAAMANLNTNNSIWCGYNNQLRRVHPEVCVWHKERNDPGCDGCER